MKVPLSWLKEYVEFDAGPEELAQKLTFSGLEVEAIEKTGSGFKGIVVGEVLAIQSHPKTKNLSICKVNDGKGEFQVVCGARNFNVGDKVPFAPVGATLPGGRVIKSASVQGVDSQGMLCAEDELGLSQDHTGLMLLPGDLPAGKSFSEVIGPPETVLTIEVTPNRPDCLSIIGVAREVAALYGKELKMPAVELEERGPAIETCAQVSVEDTEGCPRYTARVLDGVAIGPSPLWMRRRLLQCGVKSINVVVDITNYVMLECGQPLHAFDQARLADGRIVVRKAKPNEKIKTLDEIERKLSKEILIIADAKKPVAIAGVMGGLDTGVSQATRKVLLESACFKPALVRRGVKSVGLFSESSYRFERGVDIGVTEWASRRAAAFLVKLAGAVAAKGVLDVFPSKPVCPRLVCRFERVNRLLGIDLPADRICAIFEALKLPVVNRTARACTIQVPTFRMDLGHEVDLIEEVARFHGLDKIPATPPRPLIVPGANDEFSRAVMCCRDRLVGLGLMEIVNYSFVSEELLNLFSVDDAAHRVILPRPVSAEQALMRNSLLPQMGETLARNSSRQIKTASFFEMGRVFSKNGQVLAEEERLAVGLMGPVGWSGLEQKREPQEEDLFLWIKGMLESLCASLSVPLASPGSDGSAGLAFRTLANAARRPEGFPLKCFEQDRMVLIVLDNAVIGVFGLLNAALRGEWRMRDPVALLELRLAPLLPNVFTTPLVSMPSVYPSVARDMALVVEKNIRHGEILKTIWSIAPKELTDVRLFDIFYSEEIGKNHKSMAYSLRYQSLKRTLTDEEVNQLHTAIKAGLKAELKVEIRES